MLSLLFLLFRRRSEALKKNPKILYTHCSKTMNRNKFKNLINKETKKTYRENRVENYVH